MDNLPYPSISRIQEVTAFKDEATAAAALATLAWLDRGAPHKVEKLSALVTFNMRNYILLNNEFGDTNTCGTVCCIAGAIALFKDPETYEQPGVYPNLGREQLENEYKIDADDNKHPLVQLFFPRYGSHGPVRDKTPAEAASTLRQYLFTGHVEWNH